MPMSQKFAKNLLITGANRGLGLEFVKKLANRVDILFAGCRKPSEAEVCSILKIVLAVFKRNFPKQSPFTKIRGG